jgi:NAD+ diphosphatase
MTLNRLSSLRPRTSFMNAIAESPDALWIVFKDGYPLTNKTRHDAIVTLPTSIVKPLLGDEPVFGHGRIQGVIDKTRVRSLSASRIRGPSVVFIGMAEAAETTEYTKPTSAADLKGTFYLALAVDKIPRSEVARIMKPDYQFCEVRRAASVQDEFNMYLLATGRSMLDWNNRMKV